MALVVSTLKTALIPVFTPATFPSSTALAASQIASAYNTYALLGQSCAGLTPTLVNLSGLTSGLSSSFSGGVSGDSVSTIAQGIADAFSSYWTGALFGPAGSVTLIGGSTALKASLQSYFLSTSGAGSEPSPSDVADSISSYLDTFTKLVTVTDASVPCGPLPIS